MLYSFDQLVIGYSPSRKVCGPISGQIHEGDFIALLGANGAGKTTLLKTLSGLLIPFSGHCNIEDKPLISYSKKSMARLISIVLTHRFNLGHVSVEEFIAFGRYPYTNWKASMNSEDHRIINDSIAMVELDTLKTEKLDVLSDGNFQKALIARALAQDTKYIFLDEPTVHLDLRNKIMIFNLLKKLTRKTGKGMVMASHDLDLLIQLADRIWIMDEDQLISGIPEDLMLSGQIEKALGSSEYDLMKRRIIPDQSKGLVKVEGSNTLSGWVRHAFPRMGYVLSDQADMLVSVKNDVILFDHPQGQSQHKTIESLLNQLKEYEELLTI